MIIAVSSLSCALETELISVFLVKEPSTLTRMENNGKPDKPKPLRRKTVADNFVATRVDSKSTQYPATKGMQHFRLGKI